MGGWLPTALWYDPVRPLDPNDREVQRVLNQAPRKCISPQQPKVQANARRERFDALSRRLMNH